MYGGLVVDGLQALLLSKDIDRIRTEARIPRNANLKFNPRPEHLTHQEFSGLKQRVIEAAAARGCKFFAAMILHDIATSPDDARRNCINTICFHFDCYLARPRDHGLVLIDRFDDAQIDAHLREKFSIGLRGMPYSAELRLERIVGYHYSAIGQSHIPSILDIVLGSFRFAVNAHTGGDVQRQQSATTLLGLLSPLFWREVGDRVSEISLIFSPKVVKAQRYREKYEGVSAFLSANGIVPAQAITGERTY